MKNFYFRTCLGKKTGIGNYMRVSRLASILRKKGHKCSIFIDSFSDNFNLKKNQNIKFLYNKFQKIDEILDADLFIKKTPNPGIVILDDYRLRERWQKKIKDHHDKLVIIDDFQDRNYFCDVLINSKPIFLNKNVNDSFGIRNKGIKLLLGPKYSIIDKKMKKNKNFKKKFKITFYNGGSGDLLPIYKILKSLISKDLSKFKNFHIYIVMGSLSKNKDKIFNLSKKFKNIEIIYSKKQIYRKINNSNLFVGSAGISVFETALYNMPTVLFKVSSNQEVDVNSLEKIGHYFLLDFKDLYKYNKISRLIFLIYLKYPIFKKIFISPKFKIDDRGPSRIVSEILSETKTIKEIEMKDKKEKLTDKQAYRVSRIDGKYVNKYLSSRNLKINRINSIDSKKINNLNHYLWWLENNRISYVFKKNNEEIIFFYHEKIKIKKFSFIKPGWCLIKNKVSFLDILRALEIQKKIISRQNYLIPNLGIIRKDNKSMIKFAKNLNWEIIKARDNIHKILSKNLNIKKRFVLLKR